MHLYPEAQPTEVRFQGCGCALLAGYFTFPFLPQI